MKNKILSFILFLMLYSIHCLSNNFESSTVQNLQCEHLIAPLGIDAQFPRLSWQLVDHRRNSYQKAYRILVSTDSLEVAKGKGLFCWDTGKKQSDRTLYHYEGNPLKPFTRYYWKVQVWNNRGHLLNSSVAAFETGFMQTGRWHGCWISDNHDKNFEPAPYFRKSFVVDKKIRSARAYIAVAGLYDLYINGKRIGSHLLDPMFTRYDRRLLYITYDVTSQLHVGKNVVGVVLGNGWYNFQPNTVWHFDEAVWRSRPAFCMDLRMVLDDGTVQVVATDNEWKTSTGPLLYNSIYTGVQYDARLAKPRWNSTYFNDSTWEKATLRTAPAPSSHIVAQSLYPIRNIEKIPFRSITCLNDTTYVFDLGRNIAGRCQLSVCGEAGTTFKLKYGEKLYRNGHVDQSNVDIYNYPTIPEHSFQTDIFTLNGQGEETFTSHFTYHGFQYVEITANKPIKLTTKNMVAYFMHSDVPSIGQMNSSDSILNKIQKATNASYLSNLFGYPTDCPTREKNGWTGDAQIAIETGLFNFDGITIYEKWLADHRDEQQPNGILPAIIPTDGWGYGGNGPDWTSSIAIIPWNIYLFYGDDNLLRSCYDNIKKYVDYITSISHSYLTNWGLGDWAPFKSKAPVELTSSIYYFEDATILAHAAHLFGNQDDFVKYSTLANKIKNAINTKYLNATTGIYGGGTQTELSAPLFWKIVPDSLIQKVAVNLAKKVAEDHFHLDVGLLGSKTLLNALSENGYDNIAFKVATQVTYPSWGWWIKNGATTLYENWNMDSPGTSFNHIMFGEIGAWMYKTLGGLNPDPNNPGFKNIILKPTFPDSLRNFECSHRSPYGNIVSSWYRKNNFIYFTIKIPANSKATFYIPSNYIKVSKLNKKQKIKEVSMIELTSGVYEFTLKKTDKNSLYK